MWTGRVFHAQEALQLGYVSRAISHDPLVPETRAFAQTLAGGPAVAIQLTKRLIAARPDFTHVRTRHRSPETNAVIERFVGALKYEHRYWDDMEDGAMVARAVARSCQLSNAVRPPRGPRLPHAPHCLAAPRPAADSKALRGRICLISLTRDTSCAPRLLRFARRESDRPASSNARSPQTATNVQFSRLTFVLASYHSSQAGRCEDA